MRSCDTMWHMSPAGAVCYRLLSWHTQNHACALTMGGALRQTVLIPEPSVRYTERPCRRAAKGCHPAHGLAALRRERRSTSVVGLGDESDKEQGHASYRCVVTLIAGLTRAEFIIGAPLPIVDQSPRQGVCQDATTH